MERLKDKHGHMITVNEAFAIIDELPSRKGTPILVSVREALNQVLYEDVVAQVDSPGRDNSAMDGFIVRKKDLDSGQRVFPLAGEIRPEMMDVPLLEPGMCARIMTGSAIPLGGDFVVPVEQTRPTESSSMKPPTRNQRDDQRIEILEIPSKNPVRRQGEGFRTGDVLINAGSLIRPYDLGLIVESGNTHCLVQPRIRIGFQVTGSEISLKNNSNGPVLHAVFSNWPGTEVVEWPVIGDHVDAVNKRLLDLKKSSDVIITTGGISAGAYDVLFESLTSMGAQCLIRNIRQKPGKPLTVFLWEGVLVVCLPGNPVSAVTTAELYARRIVHRLLGLPNDFVVEAFLNHDFVHRGDRTVFMPASLTVSDGILLVESQSSMQSHLMQLYRGNHVYLQIEPGADLKKGDNVVCHVVSRHVL